MTMQVVISVPQGQSYKSKVKVFGIYGEAEPVVEVEAEVLPGGCFQTYLTSNRKLEVTEENL